MSKAKELLKISEQDEVAPTSAPADPAPSEGKPNTNFPDNPEVDRLIHKVASELSEKYDNSLNEDISAAMNADPVLKALQEDDEQYAFLGIRSMLLKMLEQGE